MRLFSLFLVMLLLSGCSFLSSCESGLPENINVQVGEVFSIPLGANSSTGYDWTIKNDPALVEFLGYDSELPVGIPPPGSGSERTYKFKAIKSGTTLLTLIYERSMDHGFAVSNVLKTIEITVTIR